jgi:hypothetical protein
MSYIRQLSRLAARPLIVAAGVAVLGASLAVPVSVAQTSIPKGIEQKTKYFTGFWRQENGEATWIVLVNAEGPDDSKNTPDRGVDAVVFIYGEEEQPVACGFVPLSSADIATVDISQIETIDGGGEVVADTSHDFGTIKILLFRGGEGEFGDASSGRKNPQEKAVAAWQLQTDFNSGDLLGVDEMFATVLLDQELQLIRDDFDWTAKCDFGNPIDDGSVRGHV